MKRYLFLTVTLIMFFSLAVNAFAATYYVKPDGNDNFDGRSDAKAWKTMRKVNGFSFSTGDDVYFKCGHTWTGTVLTVKWSGTSGNRVTIGAYYMDNGNEVRGVSGNKPVIDGNDTIPDSTSAMIRIDTKNYVTIENLRVTNSEGHGITFINANNVNVTNVELDNTFNAAIKYKGCDTGVIEGCDINDGARWWVEISGHGPAVIAVIGSTEIIIKKNVIHASHGEGIGFFKMADNNIAEDNLLYGNRRVNIYIDCSRNNKIRRNLIYGKGPDSGSSGIGTNDESQHYAWQQDNEISYNLIANCSKGIYLWTGHQSSVLRRTYVYNNTVVDCKVCINSFDGPYIDSAIKNNIFWCISDDCRLAQFPGKDGVDFDYNLWSSAPDVDVRGVHDPAYAVPLLNKTTGWRSMNGGELHGSEFALQSASPAKNAGTPLGTQFSDIPECNKSVWPAQVVLKDQDKQGSGWEIGADIHIVNPIALDPPTNLKIAAGQ